MRLLDFAFAAACALSAANATPVNTKGPAHAALPAVSTTCSLIIPTAQPKSLNCGVYGSLKPSLEVILTTLTATSLSSCAQQCTDRSDCISFGYSSANQCQLFGKPLNQMGLKVANSGNVIMYNRKCWGTSCATVVASSIMPTVTLSSPMSPLSSSALASTSSSSVIITTSSTSSTTVASPTSTACGAGVLTGNAMIPVADPEVNRTSLGNVYPSHNITLTYAQPAPGNRAASLQFNMSYPSVVLENIAYISSYTCANGVLTMQMAQDAGSFAVINNWVVNYLVLITNNPRCNPTTERGIYLMQSNNFVASTNSYTMTIRAMNWTSVATTVDFNYGTYQSLDDHGPYTSSCASGNPATATAPVVPPYVLSGGELNLYNILTNGVHLNPQGDIIVQNLNNTYIPQPIPVPSSFDPSDTSAQPALQARLAADGLTPPNALAVRNALYNNVCDAATGQIVQQQVNKKRSLFGDIESGAESAYNGAENACNSWFGEGCGSAVADAACSDVVGACLEDTEVGDALELGCDAKDIYDNAPAAYHAVSCMFAGNCFTTQYYTSYITKTTTTGMAYTYTDTYSVSMDFPEDSVVFGQNSGVVTCVNCGISVSSIQISGSISIYLPTGTITAATLALTESAVANLVFSLDTYGPSSGNFSYAFSTVTFDTQTVSGVFEIAPELIYSIGLNWETDSAVSGVQVGADMTFSGASLSVDMNAGTAHNTGNWQPQLQVYYPTFTSDSTVYLSPYMQTDFHITFTIFGNGFTGDIALTSQNVMAFDTTYLQSPSGGCSAEELQLQSYIQSSNAVNFGGLDLTLYNQETNFPVKCFAVPDETPSAAEISSLSAVGQSFCTSYMNYQAPTSASFITFTTSTTATSSIVSTYLSTVTFTPTTYTTTTIPTTILATTTVPSVSTSFVQGYQTLGVDNLKRRDVIAVEPAAAAPASLVRRYPYAPTPPIAATWDATKIAIACAQIATGTVTTTITAGTRTNTLGTTTLTSTYTRLIASGASAITSTATVVYPTHRATSTITIGSSTKIVPTGCPLQTQISCFSLTGSGAPHINGRQLGVSDVSGNPSFVYTEYQAFYLSCNKSLVSVPDFRSLGLGDDGSFALFESANAGDDSRELAICTQNNATGLLSCSMPSQQSDIISVPLTQPEDGLGYGSYSWYGNDDYDYDGFDPEVYDLWWGTQSWYGATPLVPVALAYQEVPCPCAY